MNRNRFKVGAISAITGVIATLLVGLTASPASAATPECNIGRSTTAAPNTPSGMRLYLPAHSGGSYVCWMAYGTQGDEVKALQGAINRCYNLPYVAPDGIYGEATKATLSAVQRQHGIHDDGEYGPDTYAAMRFPLYRLLTGEFSGTCL